MADCGLFLSVVVLFHISSCTTACYQRAYILVVQQRLHMRTCMHGKAASMFGWLDTLVILPYALVIRIYKRPHACIAWLACACCSTAVAQAIRVHMRHMYGCHCCFVVRWRFV